MSADFIDTNVLVYLLSADDAKAARSEHVLMTGGTISVQVLNEFANVARRRHKLPWQVVSEHLAVFRDVLRVTDLTLDTHRMGLALSEQHDFPIYDALIVAAAKLAGCTTLLSEDMQHGRTIGSLRIENPYR